MNSIAIKQRLSWQEILANTINDPAQLCQLLGIDRQSLPANHPLLQQFPVRVPAPYLARIEKGNPEDPLLLQVFPGVDESRTVEGYSADPLHETGANPHPGILHKYKGRALLLATSACAIHCRYCFRRHFPYADNNPGKQQWQQSLDYLAADTSISEVIFSGGDPLTLPDRTLEWFFNALAAIPHIKRIRIHTRLPVMIPQRITPELCRVLANPRFRTILVLHSNHAQEIDSAVAQACHALSAMGIIMLNQSVLLNGINDNGDALVALSERLFEAGVLPYYLHLLDPVSGAAHFDVPEATGKRLIREMQASLPGYLVPRLVRENPGEASKTLAG